MKLIEAKRIIGSLGYPSKMPGTSYGLPASACILGSKLAKVPGTVCSDCYAMAGQYRSPSTAIAHERRLASLKHPLWIEAMVTLLLHIHSGPIRVDGGAAGVRRQRRGGKRAVWKSPGHHRWHDSGDLQSIEHLRMICDVAWRTPTIQHWLPTNELTTVQGYLWTGQVIPPNLTIRVSSIKVDDDRRRAWGQTSSVFTIDPPAGAHICPAPQQGNSCGQCRACWSLYVPHVAYHKH